MQKRILARALLALAYVAFSASNASAQCGGLCLYELGSFDMGVSGAGAGARAQDPATVLFNPGGMTRLEGTQMHIGVVNLISTGNFEFNVGDGTSPNPPPAIPNAGFDGGGDLGEYLPLAGAFASHQLSDRLYVGFAFNGLWGGTVDYGVAWAGRSFVTEASLSVLAMQPTVAYRATDWLSIGAGVGATYGTFDFALQSNLDPSLARPVEIRDADDWGWYFSLGLLIEPLEQTRIGLYYRSKTELELAGSVNNPSPLIPNFVGEMTFPQGINLSVFHQLTPRIALLADAGWSDWSDFGNMVFTVGAIPITIDRGWKDTWRVGLGMHYELGEAATLMAGFSYDSDPLEDSKRLPDIPASENYRFSVGARVPVASNISLGLTYTLMWLGNDMEIDNVLLPDGVTVLDGKYDPARIHFLGIHMHIRFGSEASKD